MIIIERLNAVFSMKEISLIYNLLRDANVDVQSEGWHFNTEKHVTYTPDTNGKIAIGADILQMDVTDGWKKREFDVVRRNGYLYDKYDHTDQWDGKIDVDIVPLCIDFSLRASRLSKSISIEINSKIFILWKIILPIIIPGLAV